MKCSLTLSMIAAALALLRAPAFAHDVKDPVCRMTVDSDTTPYKQKLGNKTFYFCSKQCEESFGRSPEKYGKLAAELETKDLHEYTVELRTARPPVGGTPSSAQRRRLRGGPIRAAGQPVEMTLAIRYADTKQLVRDFELVHEKQLHLIMVTEDLAWFEHQHPVRGADGLFRLTWRFPRPGGYRLYADFTPADGDNQVKPLLLAVGGATARTLPLAPDRKLAKQLGNYRIELQVRPGTMRMEQPALLTYTIRDRRGRLIRDMQPFIGAMGHLIAISQDGKEVVHTHVIPGTAKPRVEAEALHVTPEMSTANGPAFSFKLRVPTGGLYKTWAQFMHDNRVVTVPFAFRVEELWGKPAAASKPRTVHKQPRIQCATIVIENGYHPAAITVRAGRPVELTFVLREKTGCGEVVQIPSLRLKRSLKWGESAVVTFTPKKAGTVAFTCGMDMYQGQVVVK